MGEVVDDTWDTRDDAQDELEVLAEHEDQNQNEPETKTNSNFEASLKHQKRENVCKPEEVPSNRKPTVTEIIKDNRERDDGYWEVFKISSPKNKMMFNSWLAGNRPSVVRRTEVGWICVRLASNCQKSKDNVDDVSDSDSDSVLDAMEHWNHMPNKNQKGLVDVARIFKIKVGKWMVFVPSEKVDEVWGLIATAIFNEDFGSAVLTAKVSPKNEENSVEDPIMHVICVYTSDFTDMQEVVKAENVLRNLGIRIDLKYKPDLYSYLGIYRGNPYNILPRVYSSRVSGQASMVKSFITGKTKRTLIKAEGFVETRTTRSRAPQNSSSSVKGSALSPQGNANSQSSTETQSITGSHNSMRRKTSVNPQITETSKSSRENSQTMVKSQITKTSKSNIGNTPGMSSVNTQSAVQSNSNETPKNIVNSMSIVSREMKKKEVREPNAECREKVSQRVDEDRWCGPRWHASSEWNADTKNSAEFWDACRE